MARKIAAAVFSLGCLHTHTAMALGLGELSLDSFLNEPLKASVDLLDTAGLNEEQVKIRLATKEDFERLGVDRAYFLTGISFEVVIDGKGQGKILISSDDPVLEPYLDFILEARWPAGRLLREYTVLVDPPVFDESTTVVSANQAVDETAGSTPPPGRRDPATTVTSGGTAAGYPGSTSGSPQSGGRYQISRNDTLWEIASAARPDGASVHQTMLDIQRLNPDAFIDGNINRIKAGYVIYLPESSDITSVDQAELIAEIREQNERWRETLPEKTAAAESGPSLRISAEPDEADAESEQTVDAAAVERRVAAATAALQETLEKSELERADAEERLASVQEQVTTLQDIVSIKDNQIAALQEALAEAGVSAPEGAVQGSDATETVAPTGQAEAETATAGPTVDEPVVTAPVRQVQDTAAEPVESPLIPGWAGYAAGALVLGGGVAWWLRRRRDDQREGDDFISGDVFADVELQRDNLELEDAVAMPAAESPAAPAAEQAPLETSNGLQSPPGDPASVDGRGYGERKHDEYASDVDAGDALAEADIYVAYGRYPQAIELLNNAVRSEPDNPAFRLKLTELFAEVGDGSRAEEQLVELRRIGSPDAIRQAQAAVDRVGTSNVTRLHPVDNDLASGAGLAGVAPPGLDLDNFESDSQLDNGSSVLPDLTPEGNDALGEDFVGLEIENGAGEAGADLDLTVDFDEKKADDDPENEDMVFAAEGSEMSTKLDLARAYMDMGDEEGARQILEEVASEGSDDQREQARQLLQRVG